jgi:hypothetical protein
MPKLRSQRLAYAGDGRETLTAQNGEPELVASLVPLLRARGNVILGEDHKRQFNEQQEKQTTFTAGELLIPLAAGP